MRSEADVRKALFHFKELVKLVESLPKTWCTSSILKSDKTAIAWLEWVLDDKPSGDKE